MASDGVEKLLTVSFLTNVVYGSTPNPWYITTTAFGNFTPTTDSNWTTTPASFLAAFPSGVNSYLRSLQQQNHKIIVSFGGAAFSVSGAFVQGGPSDLATSIAYALMGINCSNPLGWNRITDNTGSFYFDGIDLDIEDQNPGTPKFNMNDAQTFLTTLRNLFGSTKLITCAPQDAMVLQPRSYTSVFNACGAYVPYQTTGSLALSPGTGTNAWFCLSNIGLFDYLSYQFYNQWSGDYPIPDSYDPGRAGSAFSGNVTQLAWLALNATNISNTTGKSPKVVIGLLGNPCDGYTYNSTYGAFPLPLARDVATSLNTYLATTQTSIQTVCSSITSVSQYIGGIMFWESPIATYDTAGSNYAYAVLNDPSYVSIGLPKTLILYGGQTDANQPPNANLPGTYNPAWQLLAPSPSPTPPSSFPPPSNIVPSAITTSGFVLNWSSDPRTSCNVITQGTNSWNTVNNTYTLSGLLPDTAYNGTITSYFSNNGTYQPSTATPYGPVTTQAGTSSLTTLAMAPFLIRGPRYLQPASNCLDWYINCGAVGTSNGGTQLYGSWYAATKTTDSTKYPGQGGQVIADPTGLSNQATNTYITNLQAKGVKVCTVIGGALGDILGLMGPYTSPQGGTITTDDPADLANSIANTILGVAAAPNPLGWTNSPNWTTVAFDGLNLDFENIGAGGNTQATNTYPLPQNPLPTFPADLNTIIPNGGGTTPYSTYVTSLKTFVQTLATAAPGKLITLAPLSPSTYSSGLTQNTAVNNALNTWAPFVSASALPTVSSFVVPSSTGADALLAPNQLALFDDLFVQFYNENPDEYLGGSNFTNIMAQWGFLVLYTQQNVANSKKVKINIGLAKGQGATASIAGGAPYYYPQYQTASPPNPNATNPSILPFPNIGVAVDASNLNAALLNANILIQKSGLPGASTTQISDWCSGAGFWAGGPGTLATKALYDFTSNGVPNLPASGFTYCWSDAQYPSPDPLWTDNLPIVVVNPSPPSPLNPPTNIVASAITTSGFVLTWTSDPNTQSNVVTWGSNSSNVYGNTIAITGLLQNTAYTGTITSWKGTLQSTPTSYPPVTTKAGKPAYVPTITTITPTFRTAYIQWTYVNTGEVTGYDISYNGLHYPTKGIQTYTTVPGLIQNTRYGFQVAASNIAGIGEYSAVSNVTTNGIQPPGTPSNLTFLSATSSNLTVSWAYTGGNASHYIVDVNKTYNVTTCNTYATTTSLPANTVFALSVAGSNTGGIGSNSSVLSIATHPVQPTGLTFTQQTLSSFVVTWGGDATYYDICWNTGIVTNYDLNTITLSGLASNTQYNVVVTPYNPCNASGLFVAGETRTLPGPVAPTTSPSNIRAYNIQSTTATICWDYSVPVSSYNFYLNGSNTVYCNDLQSPTELLSLSSNTTYTLSIAAVNQVGVGPFSTQTVGFRTSAGPVVPAPLPPTNLSAILILSSAALLDWSSGIFAADDYGSINGGVATEISHPHTFQGLTANTRNTVSVYSSNATGRSSNTSVAFTTAPSIPSNVNVVSRTTTSIVVNWAGDATTYSTYIDGNVSSVRQSATSQTISNLAPSRDYIFSIVGYNPCGLAGQTIQDNISTESGLPFPPTNVIVKNIYSNAFTVSWTTADYVSKYKVLVLTPLFGLPPVFVSEPPTVITGLDANTFYTVNVASINDEGISNAPSVFAVTLPSEPSNVSASSITNTGFYLSWNGDATQYSVSAGPICQRTTSSSFIFTGLNPGVRYTTDIIPYNSQDVPGQKSTIEVTTLNKNPPAPPVILNIDNTAPTSFTVTWTSEPSVLYYLVFVDGISHIVFNGGLSNR